MNVYRGKAAVVLIEFQKQWTEKGLYHRLIRNQLKSRNVLENTLALVKKARAGGVKIIHAPLVIDPNRKQGWLAHLTLGKVFTKGSWKSEITDGLYENGDFVVGGRYAFDPFVGSNLEKIARDNNVENLFFCGFTTDQCVAKAMKTGFEKGFNCYLVSDCTAAMNGFLQQRTEKRFRSRVVNHRVFAVRSNG